MVNVNSLNVRMERNLGTKHVGQLNVLADLNLGMVNVNSLNVRLDMNFYTKIVNQLNVQVDLNLGMVNVNSLNVRLDLYGKVKNAWKCLRTTI